MSDNGLSDLVRKVTALLDKAEASDYPDEIDIFTQKAMDLMATYHIDQTMIDAQRQAADPNIIVQNHVNLGKGPYVRARLSLLSGIAEAHECKIVTRVRWDGRDAEIIGHRTDAEMTQVLYTSLLTQAVRVAGRSDVPSHLSTIAFKRSFIFGFAGEVAYRLKESRRKILGDSNGHSKALVLASRKDRVDDWVQDAYPRLGTLSRAAASNAEGTRAGREAGRSASLSTGSDSVSASRRAISA